MSTTPRTDFRANPDDRLNARPFYYLGDRSGSMKDVIEQLNGLVTDICGYLRGDPTTSDTAHLSLIAFNERAHVALPLTSLSDLIDSGSDIRLVADGVASFAAPLDLLTTAIPAESVDTPGPPPADLQAPTPRSPLGCGRLSPGSSTGGWGG